MIIPFKNCRNIPKNPIDRIPGEGDRVLRDRQKRICAWYVGTSDEDWERLKKENPNWHESIAYYDVKKGVIE